MALEPATPPANVYEGNGQLGIAVPIPGAHAEQTTVLLQADNLRVTAICKYPQESQNYLRRDWQVGSWQLELDLPRRVDPGRAHASLNYGVLLVMAPISDSGSGEEQLAVDS